MSKASSSSKEQPAISTKIKVLVAYFSHSGNTREIAAQIHKKLGGDIFEIVTVKPYPGDYNEVVTQARQELKEGYKPALKTKVENMQSYPVVLIGYPNWCNTIPMPVAKFLSEYDFSGKTLVPFCTHEGSRLGRSVSDISKLCQKSNILDGLEVRGSEVRNAQSKISEWLHKIRMIE
jgi:flavodoxin